MRSVEAVGRQAGRVSSSQLGVGSWLSCEQLDLKANSGLCAHPHSPIYPSPESSRQALGEAGRVNSSSEVVVAIGCTLTEMLMVCDTL